MAPRAQGALRWTAHLFALAWQAMEDIVLRVRELLNQANATFGPRNTASGLYRLLELHVLLYEDCWTSERVEKFTQAFWRLHWSMYDSSPKGLDNVGLHHSGRIFYGFDRKYFAEHYEKFCAQYSKLITRRVQYVPSHGFLHNRFVYTVNIDYTWKYFPIPQPISNFLLGNKDASAFPMHPFLATDTNLDVFAAGEISFYWLPADDHPRIVLLNNISGHYRPTKLHPEDLVHLVKTIHEWSDDISIIGITNRGGHIAGTLGNVIRLNGDSNVR